LIYQYSILLYHLAPSHPRLKPLKISLQLDDFRKKQFNKEEYDLVKAFDSMAIILENSEDFRVDTYENLEIIIEKFYFMLKKLKRNQKAYNFIEKIYDTNTLTIKLSHLIRYFRFKDAIIKSSVNYTRYSTIKGEL